MKAYTLNEADIEVPEHWKDGTINAFMLPSSKDAREADASLVITRDADAESADVEKYADSQLVNAAKNLNRYRLIERRSSSISDEPAMEIDFTWITPERIEIRQRQAYVRHEDLFLIFTLTSRASDFARYEGVWEETIASVQLHNSSTDR
jgi:hypothetical protein